MKGKIFNAQEVQAIINGTKTMFREVIKPYPILSDDKSYWEFKGVIWAGENSSYAKNFGDNAKPVMPDLCPYQVGQKIFCKERFARSFDSEGNPIAILEADGKEERKWRPAQHMKQEHSRLTLEITDIKVERLQSISQEDCAKEGIAFGMWQANGRFFSAPGEPIEIGFAKNWDATHKKPEEKFEANPFVWVVDFKINK